MHKGMLDNFPLALNKENGEYIYKYNLCISRFLIKYSHDLFKRNINQECISSLYLFYKGN